tara:strand:+ start:5344 stop:6426 length:1083 start_codon:yes stop_codon:yes gene_type:complete
MKEFKSFRNYINEDKNSVTFSFGRFNPPTIGHEKLIEAVKKIARGGTYRIYPSQSQDKKKNPLDFKTKVKFMRKMFPKHARNIMADKGMRTTFDVITALYDQGFRQVTMVVGSDRVAEFDKVLNKYNGVKGRHGFYQFEGGIVIKSAGERDPDAEGASGMSASKMRAAAAAGDLQTFSMGVPEVPGDSQIGLYNAVRKGMGLKAESTNNLRKHVQLEKVSDLREDYVKGNLFSIGDEVVLKETNDVGTIKVCGSNYVLVEFGDTKKRCWLDSVEKLDEEHGAGDMGTDELVDQYQKDTPGQDKILDFRQFVEKGDFKLTPELKQELEKIAKKLDDKDFEDKGHKIATAMNILKRKYGYIK